MQKGKEKGNNAAGNPEFKQETWSDKTTILQAMKQGVWPVEYDVTCWEEKVHRQKMDAHSVAKLMFSNTKCSHHYGRCTIGRNLLPGFPILQPETCSTNVVRVKSVS
jgi:hypothetical protein